MAGPFAPMFLEHLCVVALAALAVGLLMSAALLLFAWRLRRKELRK